MRSRLFEAELRRGDQCVIRAKGSLAFDGIERFRIVWLALKNLTQAVGGSSFSRAAFKTPKYYTVCIKIRLTLDDW